MYVGNIIRDLKREISGRGTIEVLVGEIGRITSQEKQERLLLEEHDKMQTIVAELRKAIADKKTTNEEARKSLTKKLTLTLVYINTRSTIAREIR